MVRNKGNQANKPRGYFAKAKLVVLSYRVLAMSLPAHEARILMGQAEDKSVRRNPRHKYGRGLQRSKRTPFPQPKQARKTHLHRRQMTQQCESPAQKEKAMVTATVESLSKQTGVEVDIPVAQRQRKQNENANETSHAYVKSVITSVQQASWGRVKTATSKPNHGAKNPVK